MSILRDIFDTSDELSGRVKNLRNRKSISREANRGVLQFTEGVTSSLPLDVVTMGNKALEREYTSFVVIMTSIDSVSDDSSIREYLGKIHQNDNFDLMRSESVTFSSLPSSLYDLKPLLESSSIASQEFLESYLEKRDDDEYEICSYNKLNESYKKKANVALNEKKSAGNKIFKTGEAVSIVNEETKEFTNLFFVKNSNDNLFLIESKMIAESSNMDIDKAIKNIARDNINLLESYEPDLDMSILNRKFEPSEIHMISTANLSESDLASEITTDNIFEKPSTISDKKDSTVLKDVLRDNDVKKANELEPTLLHLKTYFRDRENSLHPVDYIIGIKVVAHRIPSDSMINNIVKARKGGKSFFRLIQLTTGEISFFKDFVFAMDKIKGEIQSKFKDNAWFSALRTRSKLSKVMSFFHLPQQLIPNATLMISMDEVQILKSEHNVDVMNITVIKDIMKRLFLLGFVIMDTSTEVAYFMFDGRNTYEEYSFNQLERENSNSTKDIKNIMQILGRM